MWPHHIVRFAMSGSVLPGLSLVAWIFPPVKFND
jgi:hypothetical protein